MLINKEELNSSSMHNALRDAKTKFNLSTCGRSAKMSTDSNLGASDTAEAIGWAQRFEGLFLGSWFYIVFYFTLMIFCYYPCCTYENILKFKMF